jgi:hypothetical protein
MFAAASCGNAGPTEFAERTKAAPEDGLRQHVKYGPYFTTVRRSTVASAMRATKV